MTRTLHVYPLAEHAPLDGLTDSTAVVIDLLRATSTICQALAAGATAVVPLVEVEDVRRRARELNDNGVICGGERGGLAIEGFDLGNSPSEYAPEVVKDRTVLLTTSNGTRALDRARHASRTITAAAGNLSAAVESIADSRRLAILCAGTRGQVSREDVLIAGAIVHRLLNELPHAAQWQPNDEALLAADAWHALLTTAAAGGRSRSEQLTATLAESAGGRNLINIGYVDDLSWCAKIDRWDVVPQWSATEQHLCLP